MVTTYYFLLYAQRVDGVAPRGGPAASILNFTVSIGGEGFNGMRDEGRNARCRFGTLEVPTYYPLTLLLTTCCSPIATYHLLRATYHVPLIAYHALTNLLEVSVLAIDANGTTLTCSPPPVDLAGTSLPLLRTRRVRVLVLALHSYYCTKKRMRHTHAPFALVLMFILVYECTHGGARTAAAGVLVT